MSLFSLIREWIAAVKAYISANFDHFMISIGVSIVVTVIANVAIHYGADILKLLHVSPKLIHLLSGN